MAKKSAVSKSNKAHSPKQGRAQKPDREEGQENVSDYRQKIRDRKRAGAGLGNKGKAGGKKSRSGCTPKLFMLLLPFAAVGAYFLL